MIDAIRAILIMSLSGSILALILFALKPLVQDRLPKFAQYYLWLVVLAALLVPLSTIVVFPDSAPLPVASVQSVVKQIMIPTESIAPQPQAKAPELAVDFIPPSETTPNAISTPMIVMLVYAFGVLIVLLYYIISYRIFTGLYRRRNRAANAEELALLAFLRGGRNAPRLYRNPLVATPMLHGVFRPAIILPDRAYTDTQLRSVLLHETTHLQRKDVLVKLLSVLTIAVHWFNPLVWFVRREIDRACELSCDETVIRDLDTSGKQGYGDTLITVAADCGTPRAMLSTTMCEDKKALKERLGAIMKGRKRTRAAMVVSVTLIIVAMLAACALGAGSANDPRHSKIQEFPSEQTVSDNTITLNVYTSSMSPAMNPGDTIETIGKMSIGK